MSDEDLQVSDESKDLDAVGAFELLAHETRMAALDVLWRHDEPLRFSEISDRAGISDTGNFNYHFGKLVGHFVRKRGEAYELTRSGRQAMAAVLAGDVTDRPSFEPVTLDKPCPFCGAPVELSHNADQLRVLCSSCPGTYDGESSEVQGEVRPTGTLATFPFPAAGLVNRDPETVLTAAIQRLVLRATMMGLGLCPDCSGPVTITATVCPDHDSSGMCAACGSRYAGLVDVQCETCKQRSGGILILAALADPRVRMYFREHGHNLLDPSWESVLHFTSPQEQVVSVDPVAYETTWYLGGDPLSVRYDGDGAITAVERDG